MPTKKKVEAQPAYVYFVLTRPTLSHYGFTSYQDEEGNIQMIINSKNNGNIIPRRFSFSKKDRTMKIPTSQKDVDGNNVVEFLRNHPECEGSPNGRYIETEDGQIQTNVFFKELNEGRDAKNAMEVRKLTTKAQNTALELDFEGLQEVGSLLGFKHKDFDILQFKLYEFARKKPHEFLDAVESPDRQARSLVKRGINKGVLSQRGKMVKWEDTVIGADEDDAVAAIMKDKKLYEAIEKNVKAVS